MNIKHNISLKDFNTFHINAIASNMASFINVEELRELLDLVKGKSDDVLVLGGGSNILLTRNVEWVIHNSIPGIEIISEKDNEVFVKAGAGVNWHSFVMDCLDKGLAGVENLALIPGNVGASPMQNIGAYGVEIKDVFHSLEAIDRQTGEQVIFSNIDCDFGYRESVFKNKYKGKYIITSVTYRLRKDPAFNTSYGAIETELQNMNVSELSINAIAQAVMNIRMSKLPDPAKIGNAGSFFKNPEVSSIVFGELKKSFPEINGYALADGNYKIPAAWLIEQCGWKGYRKGDAGCHDRQALVLVNHGNANGEEILALSSEIIGSVNQKFGVSLNREVNVI